MPTITPINKQTHGNKRWLRHASYDFAARDTVVPLVAGEFPQAAVAMPIAFVAKGDGFVPVAVMGVRSGRNLFVSNDGRWQGRYVPAVYRADPFRLVKGENGQAVLCIDEARGLVTEGPEGEAFFDSEGQPDKALGTVLNFLGRIGASREATVRICATLQAHGLIQPWVLRIKGEANEKPLEGLFRIDETVLNALSADALAALRDGGALAAAYSQLLSMQNLPLLARLIRANAPETAPTPAEHGMDFPEGEGMPGLSSIH